ncbi:MAG: hypothetical protein Q9182_006299 [Xanthomendoza sp. 2 TL-2023]
MPLFSRRRSPNNAIPISTSTEKSSRPAPNGDAAQRYTASEALNDDSIITIPIPLFVLYPPSNPVDLIPMTQSRERRVSWFGRAKKPKAQEFKMVEMTRKEYLMYWAKDDVGRYVGTEPEGEGRKVLKMRGQPPIGPCGTAQARHARLRNQRRILEKEAPACLPLRRRALSLPLPPRTPGLVPKEPQQKTVNQLQSPLFGRLPLEIRRMIFEYSLCDFTHIHIFRRQDNRLGNYKCHATHRDSSQLITRGEWIGDTWKPSTMTCTNAWIPGKWKDDQTHPLLPLLKSCRRAYTEGTPLLYSTNTFCFDDARTLEAFTKTLLPHRLPPIRTIDITGLRDETASLYPAASIPPLGTGPGLSCLQQVRLTTTTTTCPQCQSAAAAAAAEEAHASDDAVAQWEVFIRRTHDAVTEAKVLAQKPYRECERCRWRPVRCEVREHMVVLESRK